MSKVPITPSAGTAIIDLDGIVSDNKERARLATQNAKHARSRMRDDLFFEVLFDPKLVATDTLVPGADTAIHWLREEQGYDIIYLSSRPSTMFEATEEWLAAHGLAVHTWLILKDYEKDRWKKTTVWKAERVKDVVQQALALSSEPLSVLFVDDAEDVREAIADLQLPFVVIKYSLKDALETDLVPPPPIDPDAHPLLQVAQEIANVSALRTKFEQDRSFLLRVQVGLDVPDEQRGMPLDVRVHTKGEQRVVSLTEVWPQKGYELEALTIAMNASTGEIIDVVIADAPLDRSDASKVRYSNPFEGRDPEEQAEMRRKYGEWKAFNLRELLYVESARYRRESKLWSFRAEKQYAEKVEAFTAMVKQALYQGTEKRAEQEGDL